MSGLTLYPSAISAAARAVASSRDTSAEYINSRLRCSNSWHAMRSARFNHQFFLDGGAVESGVKARSAERFSNSLKYNKMILQHVQHAVEWIAFCHGTLTHWQHSKNKWRSREDSNLRPTV